MLPGAGIGGNKLGNVVAVQARDGGDPGRLAIAEVTQEDGVQFHWGLGRPAARGELARAPQTLPAGAPTPGFRISIPHPYGSGLCLKTSASN